MPDIEALLYLHRGNLRPETLEQYEKMFLEIANSLEQICQTLDEGPNEVSLEELYLTFFELKSNIEELARVSQNMKKLQ